MTCPNCKKHSLCGCRSCKGRRINTMPRYRSATFVGNGELEKCPYCRESFHPDILLDEAMKDYDKKREELTNI